MGKLKRYLRAWRNARTAYREERERLRQERKRERPSLPGRAKASVIGGGEVVGEIVTWGVLGALFTAVVALPLLALGAPMWFAVGVAFLGWIIVTEGYATDT